MQPQNGQLSPGFITIDEAINLIKKDTRDDATVDLAYMVRNIHYIQEFKNFRIPLMKSDENKIAHKTGSAYVYVSGSYDKEILKHAIRDAFKKRTGITVDEDATHNKTTVYDPENNTLSPKTAIRKNPNPQTKSGDKV